MGLFDFLSGNGKKVFDKKSEAADKIKGQIEEDNPGVENLEVAYEEGKVKLAGRASSAEAMEKAVLLAGNVQGVEEVSTEQLDAPEQTRTVEYYVIQQGDTLSAIAKQFLGNAGDYPKIFEANREVIKDPDKIYPGQKIRIPLD